MQFFCKEQTPGPEPWEAASLSFRVEPCCVWSAQTHPGFASAEIWFCTCGFCLKWPNVEVVALLFSKSYYIDKHLWYPRPLAEHFQAAAHSILTAALGGENYRKWSHRGREELQSHRVAEWWSWELGSCPSHKTPKLVS